MPLTRSDVAADDPAGRICRCGATGDYADWDGYEISGGSAIPNTVTRCRRCGLLPPA